MREYAIGLPLEIGAREVRGLEDLRVFGRETSGVAGERLYRQGECADTIHLLLEGTAKTTIIGRDGNETLLRLHVSGSFLGLTALASRPIRDADAALMTNSRLLSFRVDRFVEAMARLPDLSRTIVQVLVDRMTDFHYRVGDFMSHTTEERLVRVLYSLSRPLPERAERSRRISLRHEDLASLIGARRPTVTAALGRLEGAGLIERMGREIFVPDRDALAASIHDMSSG